MPATGLKTDLCELLEKLRDPIRLRILTTGVMLLVGYAGIYLPLSGRIEETSRELSNQCRRQKLAHDVDCLRAQVQKFQDRLPANSDTNQWVQYVLEGIRQFPLKLNNLDSHSPERLGPYEAVSLSVDVEGEFHQLDAFLHWLETNPRLFRIDSAKIAPSRNEEDRLTMQLTLLGLKG
jgi:Tfp pilus assembly protein PilO